MVFSSCREENQSEAPSSLPPRYSISNMDWSGFLSWWLSTLLMWRIIILIGSDAPTSCHLSRHLSSEWKEANKWQTIDLKLLRDFLNDKSVGIKSSLLLLRQPSMIHPEQQVFYSQPELLRSITSSKALLIILVTLHYPFDPLHHLRSKSREF